MLLTSDRRIRCIYEQKKMRSSVTRLMCESVFSEVRFAAYCVILATIDSLTLSFVECQW